MIHSWIRKVYFRADLQSIWFWIKRRARLTIVWMDLHKRYKFRRFLHKYADRVALWEQQNDEGPLPVVWSPEARDYVWMARERRRPLQAEIKNAGDRILRGK